MKIYFEKFQGTGNDFIILDNRENQYSCLTTGQMSLLCNRRFGIGADGLMLLNIVAGYDFEMKYFNADGNPGSMCGNGSRCLVKFANQLRVIKSSCRFLAVDGEHLARINDNNTVSVKMRDVEGIQKRKGDFILDTGSPHYVSFVSNIESIDAVEKGKEIRYSKEFENKGINVNFVEYETDSDEISVRTYERGVENETLSCGTGVTASALVCFHNERGYNNVNVHTPGGTLTVEYDRVNDHKFENIWLTGPAEKVFEGIIVI